MDPLSQTTQAPIITVLRCFVTFLCPSNRVLQKKGSKRDDRQAQISYVGQRISLTYLVSRASAELIQSLREEEPGGIPQKDLSGNSYRKCSLYFIAHKRGILGIYWSILQLWHILYLFDISPKVKSALPSYGDVPYQEILVTCATIREFVVVCLLFSFASLETFCRRFSFTHQTGYLI